MFQFRRFPTYYYFIHSRLTEYCSAGLPHSEIRGSLLMCSSPQLIAACHVLLRLLMPRHSPCALCSLTFVEASSLLFACPPLSSQTRLCWALLGNQMTLKQKLCSLQHRTIFFSIGSLVFELCRHFRELKFEIVMLP